MTQKLSVDANNDLFLDANRNLAIARDLQAVLQECEHAVKTVRGELVFNTTRGVISFDHTGVFGNTPDLRLFDSRSRSAILGVIDVTDISSFDAEIVGDVLTVRAVIVTIYGQGIMETAVQ